MSNCDLFLPCLKFDKPLAHLGSLLHKCCLIYMLSRTVAVHWYQSVILCSDDTFYLTDISHKFSLVDGSANLPHEHS